jgi:serine/threonine protein kinase
MLIFARSFRRQSARRIASIEGRNPHFGRSVNGTLHARSSLRGRGQLPRISLLRPWLLSFCLTLSAIIPNVLHDFSVEARVLASLNHSNIAAIYGVEGIEFRHFLVMELVSGETLADRIKRGAIPNQEALPIAKQTEALEQPHEKGIIHRDLKPANIKLTLDGR